MKKWCGLLLVLFAFVSAGFGQAISVNGGSIQGTITDTSGAVVPNAAITIRSADTGYNKDAATDSSGFYSVGPLNPGEYTVDISATGFQKLSVKTVVRTGTATTGSFKLSVGSTVDTIEVNAGALQVNTEQAGVSDVLTNEQIQKLPINGRNFLDVAQIEPGVILQSGEDFDPTKAGYSAISVSGVSGRTTRILLDGQDITDETVGTTIFNVSQGSIDEFQLNRSTQDASGEVTSTGQVLVATKSGTNAFHGQAFYNFQDSRAVFANSVNGIAPPFQRNQFGGSVGGPIFHDKLFFFGNSERIKQDSSTSSNIGTTFAAIQAAHPTVPSPYRETYSAVRLDYNGPKGTHFFARANYNVNSVAGNFGNNFELYSNRDNTPGIAGGADFQTGRVTHSFRGSYEKFHNLIADASASSGYLPFPGVAFQNTTYGLYTGPNVDAPQGTFQSDKQFRYDGSWTRGPHNLRYGYSLNRLQGGGFAAFFGLGPRVRETSGTAFTGPTAANPDALGCGAVAGAAPCKSDPFNGYHASSIVVGNGQGFFTENAGFGLPAGATADWREGAYVQDAWKLRPSFTLTAGVRWSVDTGRANQDLATPLCSDITNANFTGATLPCSGNTPLFGQWRSDLGKRVHQSYGNFAPQIGFAYSPGDHKTAVRAGFGLFFESDVFNNTTNARTSLLKQGAFNDFETVCASGKIGFPDGTTVSTATANGVTRSISSFCADTIANAVPYASALQAAFQQNTAQNSISQNGSYVGQTLAPNGVYGAPYRSPYSEQWNAGIQREIFKGAILSGDYVHNSTLKIGQVVDQNHIGAARYLNITAARNAIAATTASAGCSGGASEAAVNCAIATGLNIQDFANNGLDSGINFNGGFPAAYNGLTPDTGAAFPGANPLLGQGSFILPIGRAGYDALQVVFRQVKAHPVKFVESSNVQISYSLSRIVTTGSGGAGGNTSDSFFNSLSYDNDDPSAYIGRASLDHKHEVNFGGSFTMKYGPQIGLIGHFYSAPPTSLFLDSGNVFTNGNIFQSDITGDGTVGDLAPGTVPGDYMHRVKPGNLASYINNFNGSYAGRLTPAGQALVSANLLTPAQLNALQATIQPIAQIPGSRGFSNPTFRQLDVNFSYPIRLYRFHEGLSLEPAIAFYNVANFANYGTYGGTLLNTADAGDVTNNVDGTLTGPNTYANLNALRTVRGSGTFSQGSPRSTEFQLKLNF